MNRNLLWKEPVAGFFRPYRGKMFWLILLTVLQSLLQVTMAVLSRFVIDAAIGKDGKLLFWGAFLVADILALVGVHALLSWYSHSTADKMMARLRQQILHSAVFSRDAKLRGYHSGALLSRGIEDVNVVCDGAVSALPSLIGQLTRLAAVFVAAVLISPPVAAIWFAAAAVVGTLTACIRPVIKGRQRRVRQSDEEVMSTMQEDLQQLELIQGMGAQKQILDRFAAVLRKNLRLRFKRRVWSVSSGAIINTATQIGAGVLLLWGASRVAADVLSFGSLTAMLQLLSLFRGPVLGLTGMWTRLTSVEVAAERLQTLLDTDPPESPVEDIADIEAVVFENVTFCYPDDTQPVLQSFNFRFPLEGWTCLTGISGRGKTTIFKLILGLYSPQEGRIYLQTKNGQIPCSEATRHLFAYVPQDYALFSGTILENMQLISPDLDDAMLRDALSVAQADFVWELSDREQTQVRENNAGLSKGQLQRLAIARAVLMRSSVYLLDECTSALDAQTEAAVLRGLRSRASRAILVTHRPEALEGLDGITPVTMEE